MNSTYSDSITKWKAVPKDHPKYPRHVLWRGQEYLVGISIPDSNYFIFLRKGSNPIRLDKIMVLKSLNKMGSNS